MSERKHTPGPLAAFDVPGDVTISGFTAIIPADGAGGTTAYVARHADVDLYRAAPEMLEALERLLEETIEALAYAAGTTEGLESEPAIKGALAAIARATGARPMTLYPSNMDAHGAMRSEEQARQDVLRKHISFMRQCFLQMQGKSHLTPSDNGAINNGLAAADRALAALREGGER